MVGTIGEGGMPRRGEEVVGEGEEGVWFGTGVGGERLDGARVWTHSATSVTEGVCVAPQSEVYREVGTQPAWSWGPVGSRLPSPGAKRRRGPTSVTRHRPLEVGVGVIEDPPGQVRVIGGGGRAGEVGRGGSRSDSAKWKNNGRRGKCARVRVMHSER